MTTSRPLHCKVFKFVEFSASVRNRTAIARSILITDSCRIGCRIASVVNTRMKVTFASLPRAIFTRERCACAIVILDSARRTRNFSLIHDVRCQFPESTLRQLSNGARAIKRGGIASRGESAGAQRSAPMRNPLLRSRQSRDRTESPCRERSLSGRFSISFSPSDRRISILRAASDFFNNGIESR